MGRALGKVVVEDVFGNFQPNVPVDLLDPVSLTRISDTVFADALSATTLSLPLTTDTYGRRWFYLATGKDVLATYTLNGVTYTDLIPVADSTAAAAPGGVPTGPASGDLTGNYPGPTLAAGVATGAKLGTDVATLTGSQTLTNKTLGTGTVLPSGSATGAILGTDVATLTGTQVLTNKTLGTGTVLPTNVANGVLGLNGSAKATLAPLQEVMALTDLTDATITSAARYQELVYEGTPKLINILHRYRPQGYAAFTGDGVTDDSTTINNMMADVKAAGRGFVEFPNKLIVGKNLNLCQTNTVVDLNGALITNPSGATATDDTVRSDNFTSLTGTASTTNSVPPAPYGFTLMNGTIDTGNPPVATQPSGRHALALYGQAYTLENLFLISQGCGSGLWEEYGSNGEDWGTGFNLRKGNTSRRARGITIFDSPNVNGSAPARVTAPPSNDMSLAISGATIAGGTTLTVTTARNHWLISGMTAATTLSSSGITGADGSFTVTVTGPTTFTVTGTFTGTYTSGGTVTYHVAAAWCHLGPHDSLASDIDLVGNGSFDGGRRGLLMGFTAAAVNTSNTGTMVNNIHIYGNFDVSLDCQTGGNQVTTAQVEGARRCNVFFRRNGGGRFDGRIFFGQGGVTMLAMRDIGGMMVNAIITQGGSGNGPPSGFTYAATLLDTFGLVDSNLYIRGSHDFNTTFLASAGTIPTQGFSQVVFTGYAVTTATSAAGYMTLASGTSSNHPIYTINTQPVGSTLTNS